MYFRKPPVTIHAFGNFLKESARFPYMPELRSNLFYQFRLLPTFLNTF